MWVVDGSRVAILCETVRIFVEDSCLLLVPPRLLCLMLGVAAGVGLQPLVEACEFIEEAVFLLSLIRVSEKGFPGVLKHE